jgi:hypothetical protein
MAHLPFLILSRVVLPLLLSSYLAYGATSIQGTKGSGVRLQHCRNTTSSVALHSSKQSFQNQARSLFARQLECPLGFPGKRWLCSLHLSRVTGLSEFSSLIRRSNHELQYRALPGPKMLPSPFSLRKYSHKQIPFSKCALITTETR